MKTIGLIGGITPQSTIMYYQVLNNLASKEYGDKHSAKVIINSVDFGEISKLQSEGKWDVLDGIMANAAKSLENAGATSILICANTMHLTIEAIRKVVQIPVIHIAKATGEQILEKKISKVALLGTKYTMEKTFYIDVLKSMGIEVIIPEKTDREIVHTIIYDELSKGVLKATSKEAYITIINKLEKKGAEGVILGCTEIPLLIQQEDVSIPVFDTTTIHATKAFNLSK
ncbi:MULTISPECIES: aspartate/glutamate racemase family protein [Tenacibaculum]|uniref:aspartate/glutamate racemase family protein n=1 Tax=Tenacibaculum TaxID=104267 RepID=UPI00089D4263|nr:aspartate/glutamate racemase family protein [Tenacibaculum sp. MAR_2010_89]SEE50154.1 aspartate racemase [Tenacibaculum sp. MAR_2010_89]